MTHDSKVATVFLAAVGVILLIAVVVSFSIYAKRSELQQEVVEIEPPPEGEFIEIGPVEGEALEKPEWVLIERSVRGVVRAVIPITDQYNCGHYAVMVETSEGPEKALFDHLPTIYPSMEVEISIYSHQISEAALENGFLWDGPAISVCDFMPWNEKVASWKEIE